MVNSAPRKNSELGLTGLISLGIGGMVGGGLFAVLGLTALMAKGATPLAFLMAGMVALLTSYSYAKLSVTYPSEGGTVVFINHAFGTGIIPGSLNVLLCLSYVIIIAVYAAGFANYGLSLCDNKHSQFNYHLFLSLVIVIPTVINIISPRLVIRSEFLFNVFKISILVAFVIAGIWTIEPQRLSPSHWAKFPEIMAGGMIIFLSYEGFELIANAAPHAKYANKNLPRAFYISVISVLLLYLLISTVAIGNLPIYEFSEARDYALAQSALPFFGKGGFILVSLAAMIASASAINAALYGSAKVSYIVAKDGELPQFLDRMVWGKPVQGLIVLSVSALLIGNLLDIESISTMASAGFLLIFAAVNLANIKLAAKTNSNIWISYAGFVACFVACASLIYYRLQTAPLKILALAGIVFLSVSIETLYRALTGRRIKNFHNLNIKDNL